jgi:hypothetical protein
MKQKINIEVGITELQKGLDEMIQGIVLNKMRESVGKIIDEKFDHTKKVILTEHKIEKTIEFLIKKELEYPSYNNPIKDHTKKVIDTYVDKLVLDNLFDKIIPELMKKLEERLISFAIEQVRYQTSKIISESLDKEIKAKVSAIIAEKITWKV